MQQQAELIDLTGEEEEEEEEAAAAAVAAAAEAVAAAAAVQQQAEPIDLTGEETDEEWDLLYGCPVKEAVQAMQQEATQPEAARWVEFGDILTWG